MKLKYDELLARINKKQPDDPKRHKAWCIYNQNNFCTKEVIKCYGSSHCIHYKKHSFEEVEESDTVFFIDYDTLNIKTERNCTVIFFINKFRLNQIKNYIQKSNFFPLNFTIRQPKNSLTMNKLKITQIYLLYENELISCKFKHDKVSKQISKDKLTISADIEALLPKTNISKKCKPLFSENDPLIGEFIVLLNPNHK